MKRGGGLLAIFYLDPWKDGEAPPPGGGPPFATSVGELDGLFAGTFDLQEDWVPERSYRGREGRERMRLLRKRV